MIERKEQDIDGKHYALSQRGATAALKIGSRLATFLIDGKLTDDVIDNAVKPMLEGLYCDGNPIVFDAHFAGQLGHLVRVTKWAAELNYGDFFGALAEMTAMAHKAINTPTASPPTSEATG